MAGQYSVDSDLSGGVRFRIHSKQSDGSKAEESRTAQIKPRQRFSRPRRLRLILSAPLSSSSLENFPADRDRKALRDFPVIFARIDCSSKGEMLFRSVENTWMMKRKPGRTICRKAWGGVCVNCGRLYVFVILMAWDVLLFYDTL